MKNERSKSGTCRIVIKGHLASHWQERFEGISIMLTDEGTTILYGQLSDQAELLGLLRTLDSVGITLIEVHVTMPG